MSQFNGQLPADIPADVYVPQTMATNKPEKNSTYDSRNYLDFSIPEGQKTLEKTIRYANKKTKSLI